MTTSSGITLSNNQSFITGYGAIGGAISGGGTVTASGGLLTISGTVDGSGTVTAFRIDDTVANSDLIFSGTLGTGSRHPTITFTSVSAGDYGKLDLSAESSTNVGQLGTISGFAGVSNTSTATSDAILVHGSGIAGDKVVWNQAAGTLTVENASGATLETLKLSGTYTTSQFKVTENGTTDTITICFMPGTMIATPDGEAAVETLKPGDLVLTTTGEAKPVNWVGRQTVSKRFADPTRSYPIRVRAGALDDNVPSRDLLISPDHALLVGGVMVNAGALINGSSITRERTVPDSFVYYHVELDDHSLILAEGAPAETFVDNVDRMNFDNWSDFELLYPNGKSVEELPYPRAKSQRQVPVSLRVALADRALSIAAAAEVA